MNVFKGTGYIIAILITACILCSAASIRAQVTFVVDDLPAGTPHSDSIFICGTFNNWSTDARFMLHKRLDGKFTITLPFDSSFQYKFHRGDWARVETSGRNQYMANRRYDASAGSTVHVFIANWQDLGGAKPFEVVSFYFFAHVFLAVAAAYFLLHIRNKRKERTHSVVALLFLLALVLLGRVAIEIVSLPWQFQIGLLGDVAMLLAGPLWYQIMLGSLSRIRINKVHFVPAALMLLLFFIRFFNPAALSFLTRPAFGNFVIWDDVVTYTVSVVSIGWYLFAGLRAWLAFRRRDDTSSSVRRFFNTLLIAGFAFGATAALKVFVFSGQQESWLLFFNRNLLVGMASGVVLVLCYFVFTYDEIFRVTQPVYRKSDDIESLKTLLHQAMKEKRLFTNPNLTLTDLSETVNVKPHILSRIINDCYQQNFRDFVNRYRVEEFIELANHGASKRFTFLALAFEVGFNSKSTFNVAFKKIMNVTPREYFSSRKSKSLKDKEITGAIL